MANPNNTYAQRHYESALDFFEQGLYDKALQQIDKAIQKSPENPDMYSTRGVFLHRMNNISQAIEAYKKALAVASDHTFSHYNLGLIYMKQNKTLQAIQEWEAVINVKPRDTDAIFNIAVALSHLGKSSQAVPFYLKVLEICPEHVQAHQNLGVIYRDEGNFSKAKFHLKKLRDLDSTYTEVVEAEIFKCEEQEFLSNLSVENLKLSDSVLENAENSLATALMALIGENYDDALKNSEITLALTPDDHQARLIKAQALSGLGKNSDAIAIFMKVLADFPDSVDAMFHLGNIFLGIGDLEKALGYYERVKKFEPDYAMIDANIASIKAKLMQPGSDE